MNLVNIGLADLGADVIHFSSSNDSQLYPPNHILMDQNDVITNRSSTSGIADRDSLNISSSVWKKLKSSTRISQPWGSSAGMTTRLTLKPLKSKSHRMRSHSSSRGLSSISSKKMANNFSIYLLYQLATA